MQSFSIGEYTFHIDNQCGLDIKYANIEGFSTYNVHPKKKDITLLFNFSPLNIEGKELFIADSTGEFFYQNIWKVYHYNGAIYYSIYYLNHPVLKQAIFTYNKSNSTIEIFLTPLNPLLPIELNPFEHPIGVLMLTRLLQENGGFLIHGSGVSDGANGYIFTGVSGIGKSTMASIWKSIGAEVVNDDRLMICENGDEYTFYNTPMPHYNDFSKNASLKGIFLLSQSPINHCTRISGVKALTKVMANFMQQFYDADVISKQLNQTEQLVSRVPVYELGFKPDTDVVSLIRDLNL